MSAAMIVVSDLHKSFPSGRQAVVAVDGVSFSVGAGEVYGLLGPNGAGKTTTLRMIVGLLRPDQGYAEIGGIRNSEDPEAVKARIGLVSASDGVYPWLTVREMLLFFAELYNVTPERAAERVAELADLLGLQSYLDRRCIALSTGQKQRVTLARALVHDPPVLLMDEPTRGLDVFGSRTVFEYIAHARERGIAVIVSTHRLDEAQRLCDRFGLLFEGRIVLEGTLAELRAATGRETLVEMFHDLIERSS